MGPKIKFDGPEVTPTRVEQAEIRKDIPPVVVKNPFTPAQKQKAYRERDPDRKREMDSLRKRKKRDEEV